jgi:hypothetical protein
MKKSKLTCSKCDKPVAGVCVFCGAMTCGDHLKREAHDCISLKSSDEIVAIAKAKTMDFIAKAPGRFKEACRNASKSLGWIK